jgi:hypothetical protein
MLRAAVSAIVPLREGPARLEMTYVDQLEPVLRGVIPPRAGGF